MNYDPHWTEYLNAFFVPVIAILGLLIANQQRITLQSKLKLELFEKRLSIYNAATAFIHSVMRSGKATDEELRNLRLGTKEAQWLLSSKIAEYLKTELYANGVDLQSLGSELENAKITAENVESLHERADIKKWLSRQYKILDSEFSEYLSLRH